MVEFALIAMLVLVLILAIMDFGYFFSGKISATNAARQAARYGSVHPTAWTNLDPPAANSIENQLVLQSVPAIVKNVDYGIGVTSYVTISYLIPGTGGGTACGQYSAASNAFVGASKAGGGTYSQAECVTAGNLVTVKALYTYVFITPMLKAVFTNLTITTEASELIEG